MTITINRRMLLAGTGALVASTALSRPALAQSKPDNLTFFCVTGGWGSVLYNQAIPAFTQATGINVEVTQLPADGLSTRLRAELMANSGAIDVAMWNPPWAGWLAPQMADHDALLKQYGAGDRDTDWKDLYAPAIDMASFGGKKLGLPYRVVAFVLYHQPDVLKAAGIGKVPETLDELRAAAKAVAANGGGKRYGLGYMGKVSPIFTVNAFEPYLYSFGGDFYDQKSYQILINNDVGVAALEYYAGMLTQDKSVPPEVTTWQTDEVIAGAQTDRYAMAELIGPWATQINGDGTDKTKGKWATEGKWAYAALPAAAPGAGRSSVSGWNIGVPDSTPNKEWAFRFLQFITNKDWLLKSIEGGNLPPTSTLETDPDIASKYAWAAATAHSLKTAVLEPRDDFFPEMDARLGVAISEVLTSQKTAKAALDDAATDWQSTLKQAGVV